MSTSSEHVPASSPLDVCCIDKLVGGELPEDERRALLLRLDSAPDGWRQCALAFLEAQMWRESFVPLGAAANADRSTAPVTQSQHWTFGRRLARRSALAASIAVAFALGWTAKPVPPPGLEQARDVATKSPSSADEPRTDVTVPPVDHATATRPSAKNPLVDSVVAFYERQGYLPERQKKFVTVKLEDGRERQVQAEEVRLRYVGGRTY